MYNTLKSLMVAFFSLATVVASVVVAGLFNGLVLSVLWRWFAAPVFHLANITIFQAWGLMVLLQYLNTKPGTTSQVVDSDGKVRDKTSTEIIFANMGTLVFVGCVALSVGWILSQFV